MSFFYTFGASLAVFIQKSFRKTVFFSKIFNIFTIIENNLLADFEYDLNNDIAPKSIFIRFFLWFKNKIVQFGSFITKTFINNGVNTNQDNNTNNNLFGDNLFKSNIITKNLFHPLIFLLFFALFLSMSSIGLSVNLQFTLIIAFISFLIACTIFSNIFFKLIFKDLRIFNNAFKRILFNVNLVKTKVARIKSVKIKDREVKDREVKTVENKSLESKSLESKSLGSKSLKNKSLNFIKINADEVYSIGFCFVLIGLVSFVLCIASIGGVPLLNPSLRYNLIPIFTMPVNLLIPGIGLIQSSYIDRFKNNKLTKNQIRFRLIFLAVIASVVLLMLGYRTPIGAIFLMTIILGYYGKIFDISEVLIGIIIIAFGLLGFGYFRSLNEETIVLGNSGLINNFKTRVDFTLNVLNLLNSISGDFGITHGRLTLSAIPGSSGYSTRMIIGELISWRNSVSITPTIIGPMLVDFGKLGVVVGMTLLGLILGTIYKLMKLTGNYLYIFVYSIIITHAVIGIETGLMEINVLMYFVLALLLCLANFFSNLKS
ncbi:MAG: oligosaccharide repeat unit polymerase family protein [Methanobrevibacter sp.]|jgi:oligosaccharide repeat unit polymerase|nr:oligosaccharide repeat unit polymerase family protein [Candidatus Methanoflexus mossambicus]